MYFAIINSCDNHLSIENLPSKFCGQNLNLFNPILKQTLTIADDYDNGAINNWKVTFFNDSIFVQTLEFKVVKTDLFENKDEVKTILRKDFNSIVAKVAIITGVDTLESVKEGIRSASWLIRDSLSLKTSDLNQLSNEWRHIDGRGLIVLEKFEGIKQPKRKILLVMLAVAYYQALQKINEQLAQILQPPIDIKEVEALFAEAAKFNARYYFFNPVQLSSYPTYRCWEDISEAYELSIKYREVNEQMEQVHRILNHQKQKQLKEERQSKLVLKHEEQARIDAERLNQQKRAEKLNFNIAVFGTVLTLFSLIEVFDTIKGWLS